MCLADICMTDIRHDQPEIVSFDTATPELSLSKPAPERLIEGSPEQRTSNFFSDSTGQFFAGTWESTPGKWRVKYAENEFCHIVRGEVHIEDHRGEGRTYKAGDSFVVPAGFSGTWHVRVPTLKLYVIFESAR